MSNLFKKKPGKPRAGQAPSQNEGAIDAPPPPPKKKKSFLTFGKKSRTAVLGPKSDAPIEAPTGGPPPMPGVSPGAQGPPGKPARKSLFGKKATEGYGQPKPLKKKKSKSGGIGGSKTSPVGLDLGRTSLSAVRLRHQTGGSVLLSAALDNLPAGLIQEGEVKDVQGLAFALKDFWKTHKIKGRRVTIGLANQKVVVRTLEFPMLDEKELRSAIEFQAQDYIPIPIEEAVLDFHILGEVTSEDGMQKQRVLVVAAQKAMVMDFIDAIKKAKLIVDGVDLQAFSMLRSLSESSFLEVEGEGKEAVAIANITSDITNIVVTTDGEPQFTRIVAFGGDNFTKSIQDLQGSTYAEAEELKAQTGLPVPGVNRSEEDNGMSGSIVEGAESEGAVQPADAGIIQVPPESISLEQSEADDVPAVEPSMPDTPETEEKTDNHRSQGPSDIESPEEIRNGIMRVLELTADALADEIRRSLDYYMSQEQSAPVSKLVLSGGGAMLANLDLHLSQVFPFPVETGNPLRRVTQNRSGLQDDELSALAPRLAIAIGLALEDEE